MQKTKIKRLVLFNLNLGFSFTEIGFVQKKSKKIISNKNYAMVIFVAEIRITWPKIAQETYQTARFKWFFELYELELQEFSYEGLTGNFDETNEFVRSG